MLIDAWRPWAWTAWRRSTSGVRQNRHQSLRDLSAMAYAVLVAASTRLLGHDFADMHAVGSLSLPPLSGASHMESRRVPIEERPPLSRYRERSAR